MMQPNPMKLCNKLPIRHSSFPFDTYQHRFYSPYFQASTLNNPNIKHFFFFFILLESGSHIAPDWPGMHYVTKEDLEILILLLPHRKF